MKTMIIHFHKQGQPGNTFTEEVEIVHHSTMFTLAIWCMKEEHYSDVVEYCMFGNEKREHSQGGMLRTYQNMPYLLQKQ